MRGLRLIRIVLALVPLWSACRSSGAVRQSDAAQETGPAADRPSDVSPPNDAPISDITGSDATDATTDAGGQGDAAADRTPDADEAGDAAADMGVGDAAGDQNPDAEATDAGADTGVDPGDANEDKTGLEKTEAYPQVVFPPENPYSDSKALLGKVLFWEEQIGSKNNQACGTCHRASAGGSDPRAAEPASLGAGPDNMFGTPDDVHGGRGIPRCDSAGMPISQPPYGLAAQVTNRKPPSYFDAMFAPELFWDGRAKSEFRDPLSNAVAIAQGGALESQAAGPPVNNVEMSCEGYTWHDIETKLVTAKPLAFARNIPKAMADFIGTNTYPQLFAQVYGSSEITAQKIIFAIATHERTLTSNNTAWDRWNAGQTIALTAEQQEGLAIFNTKGRCDKCHKAPLFTDGKFHNIGLNDPMQDPGRSAISGNPEDLGKMKTPTLRNVGLRAAGGMMHSGTGNGATMDLVMMEYNMGGVDKNNLDKDMQMLNLSQDDMDKMTNFLVNGLSDPRVVNRLPPFDSPKLSTEP
jgi:cytochrome c peroxidase